MKRIIKKIVKVILYTLLILVLAVISIFAWDKVGQKWRELNFKPWAAADRHRQAVHRFRG